MKSCCTRPSAAALAAVLLGLALTGCTQREHQPYLGATAPPLTTPVAMTDKPYEYRARVPSPDTYAVPHRQLSGYFTQGIQFPSVVDNGQPDNMIRARYYRSQQSSPRAKPLLIVLPIWDTHTYPSTTVVTGYARHTQGGAHILWPMGENPLIDYLGMGWLKTYEDTEREVDLSVQRFRAAVVDLRQLLDWAESRPEIDASRIGIIGFSMGAIVGANLAGVDPRVDTAVYMVGGARPWDIISECTMVMGWARKRMKRALDWSQDDFRDYFHDKFRAGDPALWQGRFKAENTLIIEASEDNCMPESSREILWEATGRPERIVFPYNHWQPFFAMTPLGRNALNADIYEFLDRKLFRPRSRTPGSGPINTAAGPD